MVTQGREKTLPGHGRGSHMVHKDEKNPTRSWERVTYGYTRMRKKPTRSWERVTYGT